MSKINAINEQRLFARVKRATAKSDQGDIQCAIIVIV